jgi:hypothetical protein
MPGKTVRRKRRARVGTRGGTSIARRAPRRQARPSAFELSRRVRLIGGGTVVLILLIGLVSISAQAELGAGDQALSTASSHQATVDAAMALFLSPIDPNQSQDPGAIRTESERRLSLYRDALAEVKADGARLKTAADALGWLGPVALGKSSQLTAGRQRAQATLDGLGQAEQVLTAAVDQELVGRGVFEATLKENDMLNAMRMEQYSQADRSGAQADKALRDAESRVLKADEPADMRFLVGSVRSMIDATHKLVIDRLRNDAQDRLRQEDALKRSIAEFTRYSSAREQALNRGWNETTYRPKVSAYDRALSAALPA